MHRKVLRRKLPVLNHPRRKVPCRSDRAEKYGITASIQKYSKFLIHTQLFPHSNFWVIPLYGHVGAHVACTQTEGKPIVRNGSIKLHAIRAVFTSPALHFDQHLLGTVGRFLDPYRIILIGKSQSEQSFLLIKVTLQRFCNRTAVFNFIEHHARDARKNPKHLKSKGVAERNYLKIDAALIPIPTLPLAKFPVPFMSSKHCTRRLYEFDFYSKFRLSNS